MVSKNLCLKVNVSLVEEGIAACIALKVTKYKPDKILAIFGAAAKVTLTYLLIPWCRVLID